nr:hypothetical protein [Saccharothrix australiensis]
MADASLGRLRRLRGHLAGDLGCVGQFRDRRGLLVAGLGGRPLEVEEVLERLQGAGVQRLLRLRAEVGPADRDGGGRVRVERPLSGLLHGAAAARRHTGHPRAVVVLGGVTVTVPTKVVNARRNEVNHRLLRVRVLGPCL